MAYVPLAIAVFLLLSIVSEGYQRYRRIKAGLPAVAPPSLVQGWLRTIVFATIGAVSVWIIAARLLGHAR